MYKPKNVNTNVFQQTISQTHIKNEYIIIKQTHNKAKQNNYQKISN